MKVDEVPQDGLEYKDRDKLRKLMYATDGDGKYTGVASVGWDAENAVLQQAWDEINEGLKETEEQVRAGKVSPIAWFMQRSLMDISLLARYMGKWKWTIRRHMHPKVFARLSNRTLEAYARTFGITAEELKNFGR